MNFKDIKTLIGAILALWLLVAFNGNIIAVIVVFALISGALF